MNLLSLLGKLPASDSAAKTFNTLDLQKTLRLSLVVLAGVFSFSFGSSVLSVCNIDACDIAALDLKTIFGNALQAAVAAVSAAVVEMFRRFFTNHFS